MGTMEATTRPARRRPPVEPAMLSATDTATLLGISRYTVLRMAHDGRLPAVRIGRSWRFNRAALAKLIDPPARGAAAA